MPMLKKRKKVDIHVQHGLPPGMFTSSSTFTNSLTFQLPPILAPVIDCIATGRITFGEGHLVSADNLKSLHGQGKTSEEKWLRNFVNDRCLELVKQESATTQWK